MPRPPYTPPTNAPEAAVALSRYTPGVCALGETVVLTVPAAVELARKLRKRGVGRVSAAKDGGGR